MIRTTLVLLLTIFCALPAVAAGAPHAGDAAPPFKLLTLDGKTIALDKYRGKAVYLDFFASWCAPCREETPEVIKLWKKYGKSGLVVIGMDDNEIKDRAQGFSDQFKIPFPVVIADQKTLDSYGVIALPVHVFVDRKGIIKLYRLGEMSSQQIEAAIKSVL
jgi:thiol-disulfide isomerase/thioredoxin